MTSPENLSPETQETATAKPSLLRRLSVLAAGVSFVVADSALYASGRKSGQNKLALAAIFGWTAGAIGMAFGNPSSGRQLSQIDRRLGEHLREQGIEIPAEQQNGMEQGNLLDRTVSFLHKHPTQLMNLCYAGIGALFFSQGMQDRKPGEKILQKPMAISGAMLMTGAASNVLIKEKQPDPANPPKGIFQKTKSWIHAHPMLIGGTLFNLNQIGLFKAMWSKRSTVLGELQSRQNGTFQPGTGMLANDKMPTKGIYQTGLLAVAAFTFGNLMLALSPKGHGQRGKLNQQAIDKLTTNSARIIAAQGDEKKEAVMDNIANHLATEASINLNAEQIRGILNKKVSDWQTRAATPATTQMQVSF